MAYCFHGLNKPLLYFSHLNDARLLVKVLFKPMRSFTMFMHNKRLMYTVRVGETDPRMANLILE